MRAVVGVGGIGKIADEVRRGGHSPRERMDSAIAATVGGRGVVGSATAHWNASST